MLEMESCLSVINKKYFQIIKFPTFINFMRNIYQVLNKAANSN